MEKDLKENFGGSLRVRACGILLAQNKVLLVKHCGLTSAGYLWAPPGGGVKFGQSVIDCLKQEFLEETGLEILVGNLLFVNEFHDNPLHAIELFFKVKHIGGTLQTGFDPELKANRQIIEEVRFLGQKDLEKERGPQLHTIFKDIAHPQQLLNMNGYFQNWK